MKIVLFGYGKMGREIEKILLERGHELVGKVTQSNPLDINEIQGADVAIDFSTPTAVLSNIEFALRNELPIVVGTTGWHQKLETVQDWVKNQNGSLLYASNFSIGVNLFFQLNETLAKLMASHSEYIPKITEIHHTEKLDAPSGTAISLANGLIQNNSEWKKWHLEEEMKNPYKKSLPIQAIREKEVKGTHEIEYKSEIDSITIRHEAFNRKGFAFGAVIAAEWLHNKKGIFTMKDVLQLS